MPARRIILFTLLFFTTMIVNAQLEAVLPSVTLTDAKGREVSSTEALPANSPCIISFYASWCKPCVKQLNAIAKRYADWQKQTGVRVVLVCIDKPQDADKARRIISDNNWNFDLLFDPQGSLKRAMAVQMIPHLFVLDSRQNIVASHRGYSDGMEDTLIDEIKQLQ